MALQTLREHGRTSWIAYIDLVKAFDSVDRTAMCEVLKRYGAPESLVRVIRAMHKEVIVVLKDGDAEVKFNSSLGVIQGAAASPTLFLFMIAAWLETADWKCEAARMKSASQPGDTRPRDSLARDDRRRGQFLSHLLSVERQGLENDWFTFQDSLYADDAALVFPSRAAMEEGLRSIIAMGKRWGLEVHAASSPEGKSKTEFMVVRPPPNHPKYPPSFDASPVRVGESLYITLAESKIGGVVHKNCFKYLGSFIDSELRDDLDVENRIAGATKAFGRFRKIIFRDKKLGVEVRVKAFRAFVLSILFYQSECWALSSKLRKKICCFYNRCVRSMTRVSKIEQWRQHITTGALAERMGLLPCEVELDRRCLAWAGHVVRMGPDRLARRMLWAWVPVSADGDGKRLRGKPQLTIRHRFDTVLKDLAASVKIMDGVREPEFRRFTTLCRSGWVHCAQDRTFWRALIHDHAACLADRTVRPARFLTRRVGLLNIPLGSRSVPLGGQSIADSAVVQQSWSRRWWIRPARSTASNGSQTWARGWWTQLTGAGRRSRSLQSEEGSVQAESEEWRLPQESEPEEGFCTASNGAKILRFQDTFVSAERLPRVGDFVADNGVSYYRYSNGAIVVRPYCLTESRPIRIPAEAPYTPPQSWVVAPWDPPPPPTPPPPSPPPPSFIPPPSPAPPPPPPPPSSSQSSSSSQLRRPPSARQAALNQRRKLRSHRGDGV